MADESWTAAMLLLFGMWQFHYVYRTFIYPFLHRSDTRKMPLLVVGIAFVFGLVNTYLLGSHLFTRADYYGDDWLRDPRFLVGTSMFVVGLLINRQSDRVLHDLRDSEEMGYQVPEGGLYRWVSSPNYLGEIVQWFGWAIATWSLAGLAFALWTVANLAPRARSHHQWYRQKFRDYPAERRALLPMIW
jgi:steroid 5-alpha reductase family enzyme